MDEEENEKWKHEEEEIGKVVKDINGRERKKIPYNNYEYKQYTRWNIIMKGQSGSFRWRRLYMYVETFLR